MPRKRRHMLYSLSSPSFRAVNFVDLSGRVHTRPGNGLPLVVWPNGRWCHDANTYLRVLFEKGLSRRNRGGSLAVAAAHISHLVRFCFRRGANFTELNDNDFHAFISELRGSGSACEKRSDNTVVSIGRSCIRFLCEVGSQHFLDEFVGPNGQIRAYFRTASVRLAAGKASRRVSYWHHDALPSPSPQRRRLPIAAQDVSLLRKAVASSAKSPFIRMRRHVTLKLLEVTGARRGEIAGITVEDLIRARSMRQPMLRVPTLKSRQEPHRFIPVAHTDLRFLTDYVELHLSPLLRRLRIAPLSGCLLVNARTGLAMSMEAVTHEIAILARTAGIRTQLCPHMFRHRFITKLFLALIEQHEIENPDSFRRLLLSSEAIKAKVMEWTGHSSLASLDHYIHLAFEEHAGFSRTVDATLLSRSVDSFLGTLATEALLLQGNALAQVQRLAVLVNEFRSDIDAGAPRTPPKSGAVEFDHLNTVSVTADPH